MIFEQFYLKCLSHASYLIGDETSKTAIVVDPQRDIDQYLETAKERGLAIKQVILTHFHADFVAGHLELQETTGAEICLGQGAEANFKFRKLSDGEKIEMGKTTLQVVATPGHTPESISLLVFDLDESLDTPVSVLTGDTLFVGDVGRPDLFASVGMRVEDLANSLYESLHGKLMHLPDETLVYPAHGAGSMCGKSLGTELHSTIGDQRRHNYALQPMAKSAFVTLVTADQPEAPPYFGFDAQLNRTIRPTLDDALEKSLNEMTLEELLEEQSRGALILDIREPAYFETQHLAGALNIALSGKFASWAGTLISPEQKIIIIAKPGAEYEGAMRLGRIGFENVLGYLGGGMYSTKRLSADRLQSTQRINPKVLSEGKEGDDMILDVRTSDEFGAEHAEGAINIPLSQLQKRVSEIPRDKRINVMCASGYRSAIACSILQRSGLKDVRDVTGGFMGWKASNLTEKKEK